MQKRKCFGCEGFGHIVYNYRNVKSRREEGSILMSSNKFEVLMSRVMKVGIPSGGKVRKNRKTILREEKLKEGKKKRLVEVRKVEEKLLREVMVKIGLEQENDEKEIIVKTLLDSGATGLEMSLKFSRKNKFKKKKLDRLIYVRNVDGIFNHKGPIKHIAEIELFYRGHKERTETDMIGEEKWSIILEMPWLVCYNPEIDWKTGEMKMTRCPDKCGKQLKIKQTRPG